MNDNGMRWGWIIGVVAVIVLIGLGLWWWNTDRMMPSDMLSDAQQQSTTTPQGTQALEREDRTATDIASVVASLPEVSSFANLFASTGVGAGLSGSGSYTVFVPTNGAFNLLAAGTIANMTAAEKKRLVQYHVVSGRSIDVDEMDTGTIQALSKDMLNFEIRDTDNSVLVNSGFVIKQYKAKNGMIYLISSVLVPPEAPVN